MSADGEPLLIVKSKRQIETLSFHSLDEIRDWITKEREFWKWLQEAANRGDGHIRNVYGKVNSTLGRIEGDIEQAKNNPGDDTFIRRLTNTFEELQRNGDYLLSSDPRAKFVESIRQDDTCLAAFTLAYFQGMVINAGLDSLNGAVTAILFDRGISGSVTAEKHALADLRGQMRSGLTGCKSAFTRFANQFTDLQTSLQNIITEQKTTFEKTIADSKTTLDGIAKTYDEKLALQAPVTYWQEKGASHRFWAKVFGGCLAASLVIAGLAGAVAVHDVLGNYAGGEHPPYWVLATLGVVAFAVVWALRILARLFFSHLHLGIDADERAIMVQTFLSLIREGHIEAKDERALILQSLFRHAASGIVKDDSAPPTPIEVLTRKITD